MRAAKLAVYVLAVGFTSLIPPIVLGWLFPGSKQTQGLVEAILLCAVIVVGLMWVMWPTRE